MMFYGIDCFSTTYFIDVMLLSKFLLIGLLIFSRGVYGSGSCQPNLDADFDFIAFVTMLGESQEYADAYDARVEKFTYRRGQGKLGFSESKHFDKTSGYTFTLLKFPGIQKKETLEQEFVRNEAGDIVGKSRKVLRVSNDDSKRSYRVGKKYRLLAAEEGKDIFRSISSWTKEVP